MTHHATFTYSCCRASDVDQVRHPGDVVQVHWIVTAGPPSTSPSPRPIPVTLTAAVAGPYDSITTLKGQESDTRAAPMARAAQLQTNDQAGGSPVSRLTIPSSAKKGFYELRISIKYGGGIISSGSVIQVAAE